MNWIEALKAVNLGKRIRRKSWQTPYDKRYWFAKNNIVCSNQCENLLPSIEQMLADDWELYEEPAPEPKLFDGKTPGEILKKIIEDARYGDKTTEKNLWEARAVDFFFSLKEKTNKGNPLFPSFINDENQEAQNILDKLREVDPELWVEVDKLISYLVDCKSDKYESGKDKKPLDMRKVMFSLEHGTGFNLGNALKYIDRFMTTGFEKSRNPKDLLKAIHYILFELVNHRKNGKI